MKPLLKVDNMTKRFGGVIAQNKINFVIDPTLNSATDPDKTPGIVCALIGPNGAGKTTLFNMITGIYSPDEGDIQFCGKSIRNIPVHKLVHLGIARTFQNVELFTSMTVMENVLVGMHVRTRAGFWGAVTRLPWVKKEEQKAREKARDLLTFTGLLDVADKPAGDLPIGRQKTAEIARALASDPKLLLLDEPAAGLNAVETENLGTLIEKIKHMGVTIMLVEHDMSLAMGISDNVLVLDQGKKLAQGTPRQIQNNKAVMEAYLGQG